MLKNLFFAGILKVNGENSRIRIQDPDPNPDPDPLVRSMDPRIRIRIHPKMSWIRNTGWNTVHVVRTRYTAGEKQNKETSLFFI